MDTPTESVQPYISDSKDVEAMILKNYGLKVVSLKALNGYDDRNYHMKVETEHTNPHIQQLCLLGYLVKIFNSFDSKNPDFRLGQKLLMDHCNSHGIRCQEELINIDGNFFSSISVDKEGEVKTYAVSIRTFLPGVILNEVPLTPNLAYGVGLLTANMSKAFQTFKEFSFHHTAKPLWSIENFMKVKKVLNAVKDEAQRQAAEEVFDTFESFVVPRIKEYRKSEIHGDINENNILVENTSAGVQISSIIDFQESTYSCAIYDLTAAIAYMMMNANNEVPILDIGGHMLAGYESVLPLNTAERDSLRILTACRMVMSLVYGAHYHSLNPTNDYLLKTAEVGWKSFMQLWQTTDETIGNRWDGLVKSHS